MAELLINDKSIDLGQFRQDNLPLVPGDSRQQTQRLTLPYDTRLTIGEYYIIVITDYFDAYVEENEADNIASTPVTLAAPFLPDLVVTQLAGPETAVSGTTVEYTYTFQIRLVRSPLGPVTERMSDRDTVAGSRRSSNTSVITFIGERRIASKRIA